MTIDKIDVVSDPRVQRCTAQLNGKTYGYLLAQPKDDYHAIIFLIHGFPDLSMGWRYQIPMLLQLGLRVVVPDCIGYGRTDAPPWSEENAQYYSYKRAADDIAELARQLGASRIILGGHDWGGAIVYRAQMWHPTLITHIFSVCTPFWAPSKTYQSLESVTATRLPNFRYQLQFASGAIESAIRSKQEIREFLNGFYGGIGPNREVGFVAEEGAMLDNLPKLRPTRLLTEREMDYYVDEYARSGVHGPLNWYRTREQNFKDELSITNQSVDVPVLFVLATKDTALKPSMAANMSRNIKLLTQREVKAGHWALWERPAEVNAFIKEWIEGVVFGGRSKL